MKRAAGGPVVTLCLWKTKGDCGLERQTGRHPQKMRTKAARISMRLEVGREEGKRAGTLETGDWRLEDGNLEAAVGG
jgi:hypothetical protein